MDQIPVPKRKLVAIMFTDMVGITALGQTNEPLSLAMLQEQRKLVRPIIASHQGTEIKTMGDAFLVEFTSALDAARCAYDLQRASREYNISLPEERRVNLRIGIHLGDVVEDDGDISGDAVNVASRIEPLAESGGVCLTRQVYDHVSNKFELPLESIGVRQLKNIQSPLEIYRMVLPWGPKGEEAKTALDRKRVAVLPFTNISPDPADEYLADGMTEELITALSGLGGLTVIGRTSVMQYKKAPKPIAVIGRELRAGALIEGSVRKAADRLRISVQLVDSQTEGHLWAKNYDRQMKDIFDIQSEIAESVTKELKVRLLGSERLRIGSKPTENTEAYTLYLKGRYYWNERRADAVRKAVDYLTRAVEADPSFALGFAALGDCYLVLGFNKLADFIPSFVKAKEYSEKALRLDPDLAEAHNVLGAALRNLDYEFARPEAEMRRAMELNPNYSTAHQWYGQFLWFQRRFSESEKEMTKALELDPLSLIMNVNLGDLSYIQGRFDEAIEQYNRVLLMEPAFYPAHLGLVQAYIGKGRFEEAIREADEVAEITKDALLGMTWRARVFASMGRADESRGLLKKVEGVYQPGRPSPSPYEIALVHFVLGERNEGFRWLEKAHEIRDSGLASLLLDFPLEGVRDDPRFANLANRVGLGDAFRKLLDFEG